MTRSTSSCFDEPASALEAALLRAVLEHPEVDQPRLVYADFLEERGTASSRARATLIRLQCESERAPAQRQQVAARTRALLARHRKAWLEPLDDLRVTQWRFRRGFPDGARVTATRFIQIAPDLFTRVPTLRGITFPEASNETLALAACPALAQLRYVDLSNMCSCGSCDIGVELEAFFASPHVHHLESLGLRRTRLRARQLRSLTHAPGLLGLRALDLSSNGLGPNVRLLAEGPSLASLEQLRLSATGIGPKGLAALSCAPFASRLTHLDLSHNPVKLAALRGLLPALPALEALVVSPPLARALVDAGVRKDLVQRSWAQLQTGGDAGLV